MGQYIYQPKQRMGHSEAVRILEEKSGHKVIRSAIDNVSPHVVDLILRQAAEEGMDIQNYQIDIPAYQKYLEQAGYTTRYPKYYVGNINEKSLEHYISLQLLEMTPQDVFIDLASEHSPVPEIFARLSGARSYSQDIMYSAGVHGDQIGGDACAMPVEDGFATKAALTCSIEHFEGDADTRLFAELARVLRPGGKVIVVPFYLFNENATQTDPTISVPAGVKFDDGCAIYCAEGWGNRHGRFYSPETFMQRVVQPMTGKFRFDCYHLVNAAEVDASVYARFAFVATRL